MSIDALTPWPSNYAEQAVYMQQYLARLNRVKKIRLAHVVVRSFVRPTKEQWEAAWIDQSGFDLPIPPGSKLCWMDLRKGVIRTFMTAYDLDSGTRSSGQPYEMFDVTEPLTAWHFMGVQRPYIYVMNTNERIGQYASVNVSPLIQGQRRLMSFLMIFKLRFKRARAFSIRLNAYEEDAPYALKADPLKVVAAEALGEANWWEQTGSVFGAAGNTDTQSDFTSEGYLNLSNTGGTRIPNEASGHDAHMFSEGYMLIHNYSPSWDEASERESLGRYGFAGQMFGSGFATAYAAGAQYYLYSAFHRYDAARVPFAPVLEPNRGAASDAQYGPYDPGASPSGEWSNGSKIWLYGMYGKNLNNAQEYD